MVFFCTVVQFYWELPRTFFSNLSSTLSTYRIQLHIYTGVVFYKKFQHTENKVCTIFFIHTVVIFCTDFLHTWFLQRFQYWRKLICCFWCACSGLFMFCLKLMSFSFAATFLMHICVFMPDSVWFGGLFACLHVWLGLYLPSLVFEDY